MSTAAIPKSPLTKIFYLLRDLRSRAMFSALRRHCHGSVLDVGGWDFYITAQKLRIPFTSWTTLECDARRTPSSNDSRIQVVIGDGCSMSFAEGSFDTVLCIQVLEHVFDPLQMMREIARVLKPGGTAIFVIPQTANLHGAPTHFYNFTIFWIVEAVKVCNLQTVELKPMGGAWSSLASRYFFLVFQGLGLRSMSYGKKRSTWFYVLFPLMLVWVTVSVPICLFFSFWDLPEEANNHVLVARRPAV